MWKAGAKEGFSLVECLIAMTIVAAVCAAIFQLFHQNERVFRDQTIVLEMQQAARAAASQIADDIRVAGQGVPVYASTGRPLSESTTVLLAGSDPQRLNIRAGVSNIEGPVAGPYPLSLSIGSTLTLKVPAAAAFSAQIGTSPTGHHAYIWDFTDGWVRVLINSASGIAKTLGVTVVDASSGTVVFQTAPTITLEEAIAIFYDQQTRSIRRTTSTSMANPVMPVWASANQIAANVRSLQFQYYDDTNAPVVPDTLQARAQVARIDVQVVLTTATSLSNGSRPVFSLSLRTIPRNLAVR
jgi:prepilin-type N-terminal cleavage/methylation domain-containing protein